jgi:hypothetical protein
MLRFAQVTIERSDVACRESHGGHADVRLRWRRGEQLNPLAVIYRVEQIAVPCDAAEAKRVAVELLGSCRVSRVEPCEGDAGDGRPCRLLGGERKAERENTDEPESFHHPKLYESNRLASKGELIAAGAEGLE